MACKTLLHLCRVEKIYHNTKLQTHRVAVFSDNSKLLKVLFQM